ncbi:MAG: hypothetical protein M3Y53_07515 [Thermoproteota archaeon]|nr:hypothetical protein [Thermoproteota archaeon]
MVCSGRQKWFIAEELEFHTCHPRIIDIFYKWWTNAEVKNVEVIMDEDKEGTLYWIRPAEFDDRIQSAKNKPSDKEEYRAENNNLFLTTTVSTPPIISIQHTLHCCRFFYNTQERAI